MPCSNIWPIFISCTRSVCHYWSFLSQHIILTGNPVSAKACISIDISVSSLMENPYLSHIGFEWRKLCRNVIPLPTDSNCVHIQKISPTRFSKSHSLSERAVESSDNCTQDEKNKLVHDVFFSVRFLASRWRSLLKFPIHRKTGVEWDKLFALIFLFSSYWRISTMHPDRLGPFLLHCCILTAHAWNNADF